ncbi:MAG: HD domain-containing phosphohydrolase, partial [Anaerobacillus sp.]
FDVIKTHPVVGDEALRNMKGLESCLDVVRYHHERWDGKGYPDQLKGEDIPLLARVTSIADAFDAMTSTRSYRPAMDPEIAYQQILEGSGTQFDPNLVDVFITVFPKWVAFHSKYEFKAPLSSNILDYY